MATTTKNRNFFIKQFWPFEETSIFSNGGHLGWRAWLSDIFFKGTHTGTITARFGLIWFSGFRGEDCQFKPYLSE
jgi:hypothetical protein